jgi:3-oxoacyl-[acyl-carrier-protein] synthase-1
MMRRVVVTGMGIVSAIGNNTREVLNALRQGRSGIAFIPAMREFGYRCQVAGLVKEWQPLGIAERTLQTMSNRARYAASAALEALEDAQLTPDELHGGRVGISLGTGLGSANEAVRAELGLISWRSPTRLGATGVAKMVGASSAANLAAWLGVKGRCYAVSSACATGVDNIGHGFELIRHDLLDLCLCGGDEEQGIANAWGFFDATNGMPTDFNGRPHQACRPYDRYRQGMVLSEGAGVLILEALEHAERRGVRAYAEVIGYGSANDGDNMFEPTGMGLRRCLEEIIAAAAPASGMQVDYINAHGTGTRVGDPIEVRVLAQLFGTTSPLISSTKGLTGHSLGAAGTHEAIYTLLMLQHGFIVPTFNLDEVAPECRGVRHVRTWMEVPLRTAITFNAGLGGTNAGLMFRRL